MPYPTTWSRGLCEESSQCLIVGAPRGKDSIIPVICDTRMAARKRLSSDGYTNNAQDDHSLNNRPCHTSGLNCRDEMVYEDLIVDDDSLQGKKQIEVDDAK